jgi:hypothetical protein
MQHNGISKIKIRFSIISLPVKVKVVLQFIKHYAGSIGVGIALPVHHQMEVTGQLHGPAAFPQSLNSDWVVSKQCRKKNFPASPSPTLS